MNEQPIVRSTFPFGISICLILVGIGMLKFATFLWQQAFQEEYLQLPPVILCAVLWIMGVTCIVLVFAIPKFEIYTDRLEIKSIWGTTRKIIYRNEIISWSVKQKEGPNVLTIFSNQTKHKIYSITCKNFDKIKNELTKGKFQNADYEANIEKKIQKGINKFYALVFFLFGCFLIYGAYSLIIPKKTDLRPKQLTSVEGIITNVIRKDNRSILLKLSQYPNFTFIITGNDYYATYVEDFISKINAKDTIAIDILTDEYEKKITRVKPMSFFEKSVDYRFISFYGLRDKEKTLRSLRDYNNEKKSDNASRGWFLGLFGVLSLGFSLYQLNSNK